MAKRFTDTAKWNKPFLRSMKGPYKLLWLYILDECDHAGIWQVDFEVAQIKIGEKLNRETAINFFGSRIQIFNGGLKWFIYDFIDFQYGPLNPHNRAHKSVINILEKYNIDYQNKPLESPLEGAKDKEQDKDMDKDKDKVYRKFKHLFLTCTEFDKILAQGYTNFEIDEILNEIENYKPNVKYTSLYLTALKWLKKRKTGNVISSTLNAHKNAEKALGIHE